LRKLKYVVAEEEIHHLVNLVDTCFVTLGYWIYCNKAMSNKFRSASSRFGFLAIVALSWQIDSSSQP
jgi:hypothetical protein